MQGLLDLLGLVADEVNAERGRVEVVIKLKRVLVVYMHCDAISISLRRPRRGLVVAAGRVIVWDDKQRVELRVDASVEHLNIDGGKLRIMLRVV